jgi:PhzF family phenazine biosynthesis protein
MLVPSAVARLADYHLIRQGEDYRLRWFTPTTEVPLCGHATLASAAVVMERPDPGSRVVFDFASMRD